MSHWWGTFSWAWACMRQMFIHLMYASIQQSNLFRLSSLVSPLTHFPGWMEVVIYASVASGILVLLTGVSLDGGW